MSSLRKVAFGCLLLGLAVFCKSCIPAVPESGLIESKTYKRQLNIKVAFTSRSYLIHVPKDYEEEMALPLVVVLHGAFSTAREIERQSGFSALGDRHRFLVAYPNAAYGILGLLQHWNAGHCCGKAASNNLDDVGFLDAVIEDVQARFSIDRARIHIVGFSNGGMMAFRYASERSGRIAAAGVVAASIGGKASAKDSLWIIPGPEEPVPIICFHGGNDLHVPYEGGRSPKKGGKRKYLSVAQSIEFWVISNRCVKTRNTIMECGGRVRKDSWHDEQNRNAVVLYSIQDWGHKWPGRYFTDDLDESDVLKGFDAGEMIWEFFENHRKRP